MLTMLGTTAMIVLWTMGGQTKEKRGEREQAFIEHQQIPDSLNIHALLPCTISIITHLFFK